jgi:hypothetical protein
VKSKKGGPPRKETLKVAAGGAIEGAVAAFCQQHEVGAKECDTLSSQVVTRYRNSIPAALARSNSFVSPVDLDTFIVVKSKWGKPQRNAPFVLERGTVVIDAVTSFCKLHNIADEEREALLTQAHIKYSDG